MALKSKTPVDGHGQPVDGSAVYTCFEPYCAQGPDGVTVAWPAGTRLAGTHAAVRQNGEYWHRDGSPPPVIEREFYDHSRWHPTTPSVADLTGVGVVRAQRRLVVEVDGRTCEIPGGTFLRADAAEVAASEAGDWARVEGMGALMPQGLSNRP